MIDLETYIDLREFVTEKLDKLKTARGTYIYITAFKQSKDLMGEIGLHSNLQIHNKLEKLDKEVDSLCQQLLRALEDDYEKD